MQEGKDAMPKSDTGEDLRGKFQELAARLAATGPILQGSITERVIPRRTGTGKAREKTYGPYYQWTYKRAGKTVTVNLTAEQAKFFGEAINNNRTVESILGQMRELSRQFCEQSATGVKKRKRRKPPDKP